MAGGGFNSETLSSLLTAQEEEDNPFLTDLIASADSDDDGALSLTEIGSALGVTDTSGLTEAFAKIDTDGDGVVSTNELDSGLKQAGGRRGPPPPSSADMAAILLDTVDNDASGSVSLGEITSALGENQTDTLADSFARLDEDADGSLNADELGRAIEGMFNRRASAYAAQSASASTLDFAA